MDSISLTVGMRSDLVSLQGTAQLLTQTQGRLSSGKAVNSAVDDPSKYFAAQDHLSHASDLSARKSDMGEAIQAVKTANQGITTITSLISQAQGLVQSAGNATVATRATLAKQFNALRTQIDQVASDSGYNGKNFLQNGSLSVLFNESGSSSLSVSGFFANSSGLGITTAAIGTGNTVAAEAVGTGTLTGTTSATTFTLTHTGAVSVTDLTLTQTYHVSGESEGALVAGATGATVVLSGSGTQTPTSVVIYASGTALAAADYTVKASGGDLVVTFTSASTAAQFGGAFTGSAITADYTTVNTLTAGQFTATTGTSATAASVTFASAITGSVTSSYATQNLWGSDTTLSGDTANLNTAITALRAQASTMAANLSVITARQDWSVGMINNLQTGSDNLTLADMNQEGANMLALQTRQQLGIQALSLASQANQSVMRLFG